MIDESKGSHRIIKGLKSHNWYQQNSAIELLTTESVARMAKNNLFVIGRNIYQAACGTAHDAVAFIKSFASNGYAPDKRKAILDGMLFEVFFNAKGKLRDGIKSECFDEVFSLQRHAELKPSFDFIANALTAAQASFYSLPGKGHELAVTVTVKETKGTTRVTGVYVNGTNVLRPGDGAHDDEEEEPFYRTIDREELEKELSVELVVPSRLLKLTYTPSLTKTAELKYPAGWTVRKDD